MAESSKTEALAAVKRWFDTEAPRKWGLQPEHVRVLSAALKNLLETESWLDVPHFRSKHRQRQLQIDWLASGNFIRQETGPFPRYELDFRGFATLLGSGDGNAQKLRVIMDRILVAARKHVQAYPRLTQMRLESMAAALSLGPRERRLEVAIHILSTSSLGIHSTRTPSGEQMISFSDHIFTVGNVSPLA